MAEKPVYKNGKESHGMRGTVIPGAKRDEHGRAMSNQAGVQFDLHEAAPMNIIESEETADGGYREVKVQRLDTEALTHLKRVNSNKSVAPISFDEAISASHQAGSAERPVPVQDESSVEQTVQAEQPRAAVRPKLQKTPVRFTGPFGSLRVGYDRVVIDNGFLVLIQEPGDMLYEAPAGLEQHIKIETQGKTHWCLVIGHYTIPQGASHTVFALDPEYVPDTVDGERDDGRPAGN